MRTIGKLATTVPRILDVSLESSGWSDFWTEIRKIAKAVTKQRSREAHVVARVAGLAAERENTINYCVLDDEAST